MRASIGRSVSARAAAALCLAAVTASPAFAGDLVRMVRYKLSAADIATGEAAVEEYKRTKGVDKEYLDAVGWLARGSEMLGRRDKAAAYIAELRREIPVEKADLVVPYGAAIEVEGKLRLAAEGRGAAIRYLETELAAAQDVALRSRIRKNLNLLGLEGQKAPEIATKEFANDKKVKTADLAGKPCLLFFWAHGCGDCKAEGPKIERLAQKYATKGVTFVAPTRLYGSGHDDKPLTPAEEMVEVAKGFIEIGLASVPAPVDTETMVRYGASATPTVVLLDRKGTVRFYSPTRVSEAELSRRLDALLAEPN